MIFETDKFEFDSGKRGNIAATNKFRLEYFCSKYDCTITYGFDHVNTNTITVSLEDAEKEVVKLVYDNVKKQGAKITSISRKKQSFSSFPCIMEALI